MDELLMWPPKGLLGECRKVDTTLKLLERLRAIDNWSHQGGVLILGYEMFRSLFENRSTTKRGARLNKE
jgi:hypothetical protein